MAIIHLHASLTYDRLLSLSTFSNFYKVRKREEERTGHKECDACYNHTIPCFVQIFVKYSQICSKVSE